MTYDAATITAIAGASVLIIGAIAAAAEKILKALNKIHVLVNSKHSQALNDLAIALAEVADKSGLNVDVIAAEVAKQAANAQRQRAEEAKNAIAK